jgi:hypothetical protein
MVRMIAAKAVFVAAVCFAAVTHFAAVTQASQRRVAVLQGDRELLRAFSLALSPWGIDTLHSDIPAPAPQQTGAAARLATQLNVVALVWITNGGRPLLWVFDADTGHITTRVLTQAPPFDSATAASVALTFKTLLRGSDLAPATERLEEPFTAEKPAWALQLGAGGHRVTSELLDWRAHLAGVFWLDAARRLGVSLEVSAGPGLRVQNNDFSGRYREYSAGAKARARLLDLANFFAVVGVGGGARWAHFSGTLTEDPRTADVARVNGSVDLETSFNFRLTDRVYLGALIGAAYFPAYRRYFVRDKAVLAPSPLSANLAGHCGIELF